MTADPAAPREAPVPSSIVVLHRDEAIAVVDKPSGLSVHRGDDQGSTFALNLSRDAIGQWVYPCLLYTSDAADDAMNV